MYIVMYQKHQRPKHTNILDISF